MKELSGFLSDSDDLQSLAEVLDEALHLIEGNSVAKDVSTTELVIQDSLFEQCIDLCRQVGDKEPEPLRSIHHLACTGGTLITKCLAAMPNVMALNEVDPLSNMLFDPDKPKFSPSDMLALVRQGDSNVSDDILIQLFVQNLIMLRDELALSGKRILLRDHSHSQFMMNQGASERPSLLDMVTDHFVTHSIVTVRNPLDSYLSLEKLGWRTFQPFNLEEYCARYLTFLDVYEDLPIYRYEDFVEAPKKMTEQMCYNLDLVYSADFTETFDVFRFSGDSGRVGRTIKPRTRRSFDEKIIDDANNSVSYNLLIGRLGYEAIDYE